MEFPPISALQIIIDSFEANRVVHPLCQTTKLIKAFDQAIDWIEYSLDK